MKTVVLSLSIFLTFNLYAAEKGEGLQIAKGIQCTNLREKSFLNFNEQYSTEKFNQEYIKKVSDGIYAQAFRICDPENTANADKEILNSCNTGCDQSVVKGVMGIGGSSASDIEKCKKFCQSYTDYLSVIFTSASKAIAKHIEQNPPTPKKMEAEVKASTSETPATQPALPASDAKK